MSLVSEENINEARNQKHVDDAVREALHELNKTRELIKEEKPSLYAFLWYGETSTNLSIATKPDWGKFMDQFTGLGGDAFMDMASIGDYLKASACYVKLVLDIKDIQLKDRMLTEYAYQKDRYKDLNYTFEMDMVRSIVADTFHEMNPDESGLATSIVCDEVGHIYLIASPVVASWEIEECSDIGTPWDEVESDIRDMISDRIDNPEFESNLVEVVELIASLQNEDYCDDGGLDSFTRQIA